MSVPVLTPNDLHHSCTRDRGPRGAKKKPLTQNNRLTIIKILLLHSYDDSVNLYVYPGYICFEKGLIALSLEMLHKALFNQLGKTSLLSYISPTRLYKFSITKVQ